MGLVLSYRTAASAAAPGFEIAGRAPAELPAYLRCYRAARASAPIHNAAARLPGAPALLHRPGESRNGQRPGSPPGLEGRAAGLGMGSDGA